MACGTSNGTRAGQLSGEPSCGASTSASARPAVVDHLRSRDVTLSTFQPTASERVPASHRVVCTCRSASHARAAQASPFAPEARRAQRPAGFEHSLATPKPSTLPLLIRTRTLSRLLAGPLSRPARPACAFCRPGRLSCFCSAPSHGRWRLPARSLSRPSRGSPTCRPKVRRFPLTAQASSKLG